MYVMGFSFFFFFWGGGGGRLGGGGKSKSMLMEAISKDIDIPNIEH